MSRTLKRVPLTFDWPLHTKWVNPYYGQATECPDCAHGCDRTGGRPDANAALFYDQWYSYAPFDPIAYGAEPLSRSSAALLCCARWHAMTNQQRTMLRQSVTDSEHDASLLAKVPTMTWEKFARIAHIAPVDEFALAREAERLYQLWCNDWCHPLIQADVDALLAHDRLWDFTRVPITDEQREVVRAKVAAGENSWLPYDNGYHPTAAEVNAWSIGAGWALVGGHDGVNQNICVRARCEREGVPLMCERCDGVGKIWPSPESKRRYEEWKAGDSIFL